LNKYSDRISGMVEFLPGTDFIVADLVTPKVVYDRPVLVSATVHELGRLQLAMKWTLLQRVFGDKVVLLYTDTDSLIVQVETDSWEREVHAAGAQGEFDFSNYPSSSQWYCATSETGMMKSETADVPIERFYSTGCKSYLCVYGDRVKQAASGVDLAMQRSISELMYQQCLRDDTSFDMEMSRGNRTVLSPFDAKSFQHSDGSTYPYGHSCARN
jgi:hypothetical protein